MTTKFKAVPVYENDATVVRFEAVADVPGFTHRVVVIDKATRAAVGIDWLGAGYHPTAKNAAYYAAKLGR